MRPTTRFATTCLLAGFFTWAGCESFVDLINQSLVNSAGQGQPFADANAPDADDGMLNGMPALIYDIEIKGFADGPNGGYFEREGTVYVLNQIDPITSGNIVEVLIESGQPETSADLGAFLFATHTGLYRSTNAPTDGGVDLAFVDLNERDETVTLTPDTGTLAITNSRNSFTTGDGVVQELYLIDEGQIILEFPADDTVGGVIDVSGLNLADNSEGSYEATLRGELRGTAPDGGNGEADQ
jgi:hypothetical protein